MRRVQRIKLHELKSSHEASRTHTTEEGNPPSGKEDSELGELETLESAINERIELQQLENQKVQESIQIIQEKIQREEVDVAVIESQSKNKIENLTEELEKYKQSIDTSTEDSRSKSIICEIKWQEDGLRNIMENKMQEFTKKKKILQNIESRIQVEQRKEYDFQREKRNRLTRHMEKLKKTIFEISKKMKNVAKNIAKVDRSGDIVYNRAAKKNVKISDSTILSLPVL